MLQITLTKGKNTFVDECDKHLKNYRWQAHSQGYASRGIKIKGKQLSVLMHHAIIGKPINKMLVDHIDGNKLNNTRSNLRIVDRRENARNSKYGRGEKEKMSKFFGVDAMKNKKGKISYRAKTSINGKYWIGKCFKNEEDAAYQYKEMMLYLIKGGA